jgi:putative acetyltransferase
VTRTRPLVVRRETRADADAVRAVHATAFPGDGPGVSPEARLVDRLRADGDLVARLSFVAQTPDGVVGHVATSRGHLALDVGREPAVADGATGIPLLGVGPVGVLPEVQGRGVGTALLHAVVAAADALDEPALVLLGSPDYYGRFGFVAASAHGVRAPDPLWGMHFQLRPLTAWDPELRGVYAYAPAFDVL